MSPTGLCSERVRKDDCRSVSRVASVDDLPMGQAA